jgi:trimeric autotransporter adhesin
VADGPLRAVNPGTGQLTTTAGDTVQTIGPLGDGGLATSAYLDSNGTPAVDGSGNLIVPDTGNYRVRVVAETSGTFYGQQMTAGHIYTVAGDGTPGHTAGGVPATQADLEIVAGVAVDSAGNLVIADSGGTNPAAASFVQVVAAKTGTFYGQNMTAGDIYNIAGKSGLKVSGNGGPALKAGLGELLGQVELDQTGDVVLADDSASSIRVVAAKTGTFYGQPMKAGDIYAVAGTGTAGYSGDGGPATGAELDKPTGVTVDGAGNLVVADTDNSRVRVVAVTSGTFYGQPMTAGDIYSIAGGGTGGDGRGVAIDGTGNVLVADYGESRVRLIAVKTGTFYQQAMTANDIYTIAGNGSYQFSGDGGPAGHAVLDFPGHVAFGSAGQLAVSDSANNRLRLVPATSGTYFGQKMTAGHIYTIAGDGQCDFSGSLGNGGPALEATMCEPTGLSFDSAGNMLFTDTFSNEVRVVAASSGTFYGQKMTVGYVYSVAGDGTAGFSGDGGPATEAELDVPRMWRWTGQAT